jgi:hypothetical protein
VRQIIGIDSDTCVRHCHHNPIPRFFRLYCDLALFSIFDGIINDVGDRLPDLGTVDLEHRQRVLGESDPQLQALRMCREDKDISQLGENILDVRRGELILDPSRLDARDIEQVFHQVHESIVGEIHLVQSIRDTRFKPTIRAFEEKRNETLDCRQWRPKLMRSNRDELALCCIQPPQLGIGDRETIADPLQLLFTGNLFLHRTNEHHSKNDHEEERDDCQRLVQCRPNEEELSADEQGDSRNKNLNRHDSDTHSLIFYDCICEESDEDRHPEEAILTD